MAFLNSAEPFFEVFDFEYFGVVIDVRAFNIVVGDRAFCWYAASDSRMTFWPVDVLFWSSGLKRSVLIAFCLS